MLPPRNQPLGGKITGAGGAQLTPQQVAEQQKIARALLMEAGDTSPVGHWTAALNRGLQGWLGGRDMYRANQTESQNTASSMERFNSRNSGAGAASRVAEALAGGAASSAAQGGSVSPVKIDGSKESFIQALLPTALEVSEKTGVDPRIIIAQAAQETGWGKSAPNNNFFGIKSHGKGGGGTFATTEYVNGQPVTIRDSFRGYETPADSVRDYGNFLMTNKRYKPMLEATGNLDAQIAALGASGYATDPNYANAIRNIATGLDISAFGGSPGAGISQAPAAGNVSEIATLLADPWLPKDAKAVLQAELNQQMQMQNAAYQQQLQQQDPMYQMQMQRAQLELQQMQNPTSEYDQRAAAADQFGLQGDARQSFILTGNIPGLGAGTPADFQALKLRAEAAGLAEGSTEYKDFMRTAGRATNAMPAAVAALHERALRSGLIEDTPEYENFMLTGGKGVEAGAAVTGKTEAEMALAAPAEINSADDTLRYIQELRDHPGRKAGTGASSWTSIIPGTSAKDFGVRVAQLEGGAFLTAIGEMQGMGALSNQEGQTAKAAIARLNTATTEEGFMSALDDYERIIKRGRERAQKRLKVTDSSPEASQGGEESDDDFLKRMGL